MLDDLKLIHERDAEDTLGIAERQGRQLAHKFETSQKPVEAENIRLCRHGRIRLWPACSVPVGLAMTSRLS